MIRVFMLILRLVGAAAFLWLGLFGSLACREWRGGGAGVGGVGWSRPHGCLGKFAQPRTPPPQAASWGREGRRGKKKAARNEARPIPSRFSFFFFWFYFDADISDNSL